jgi:hypothetical protein
VVVEQDRERDNSAIASNGSTAIVVNVAPALIAHPT